MAFFYAPAIKHDGLTRTIKGIEVTIQHPGAVRLVGVIGNIAVTAKVNANEDGDLVITEITTANRPTSRPGSKAHADQQAAYDALRGTWTAAVDSMLDDINAFLTDPILVDRTENIMTWVTADIRSRVNELIDALQHLHKAVTRDNWISVGSLSSGSIANREIDAAMKQSALAAVVKTYDYTFGAFVNAMSIAEAMIHEAREEGKITMQVSLYS